MYFCIDGSSNEVVIGSKKFPIENIGFEFSVTVEAGTLSIHWYKGNDRFWTLDFPWRPQLVDLRYTRIDCFYAFNRDRDIKEYEVYEVQERFVPWFLRKCRFLHSMYKWKTSTAIGFDRDDKTTYRRVISVATWLQRNHLEVVPRAIPRLHVPTDSPSTS